MTDLIFDTRADENQRLRIAGGTAITRDPHFCVAHSPRRTKSRLQEPAKEYIIAPPAGPRAVGAHPSWAPPKRAGTRPLARTARDVPDRPSWVHFSWLRTEN